jgi:hypothetical protein
MTVEEDVDTLANGRREGNNTVDSRATVENADEIGKVIKNRKIVLDDNDVVIGTEKATDGTGSSQTLLDIKIRRGLVKHVPIDLVSGIIQMQFGFSKTYTSAFWTQTRPMAKRCSSPPDR